MEEPCYFIFNDISSEEYLGIKKLPSLFKVQRDVDFIEVLGRDGYLTQDLGTYRGSIKTVECQIKDITQVDYICSWLNGGGKVTFSNEPDKYYNAIIKNQIEFSKIVKTYHTFIIQFDCQPFSYPIFNSFIEVLEQGQNIDNLYTHSSTPKITVYGQGNITLTIKDYWREEQIVHLFNVVDQITIDSTFQECYKDEDYKEIVMANNQILCDEYPILKTRENYISWTGNVTSIEVLANFRFL